MAAEAAPKQRATIFTAPPQSSILTTSLSTSLVDPADVRLCGSGCAGISGTTTIITSDALPTLSFTLQSGNPNSGEAYLAILVPGTASLPTFTVNGSGAMTLANSTFSSGAFTDYLAANVANLSLATGAGGSENFSAMQSATGQVTSAPSSFSVFVFDLGAYTGAPLTITFNGVSALPVGTIFWGFLTTQSCSTGPCTMTDTTPLSAAVTVAPEPGTLALVGSGLLLLGIALRRRLVT
jgi:hypothetical protein